MATHSSVFAWRIPWTEEPGGRLCSSWGHKESDTKMYRTLEEFVGKLSQLLNEEVKTNLIKESIDF